MENSVEVRLRKTAAIITAKNIGPISVSAFCEKAGVSRASFYLYYKDMEDFTAKLRLYIIDKLDEQLNIIFDEGNYADKNRYRIVLSDDDIALLNGLLGSSIYIDFAVDANNIIGKRFREKMIDRWGEEFYKENEERFEFMLNGGVASLYVDFLDYNKETYIKNMHYITEIAKDLFPI